jgi:hypothetical protein
MGKRVSVAKVSIFGIALVLGGLAGRGEVVPANAAPPSGAPFVCEPGFFQVISGQLKELNPVTDAYTNIGPVYTTTYNAMGYNVLDNYLYAMGTGSAATDEGDLLRIASDGTVTNLGRPTGLPLADYVSGDMDNQGHLIVQGNVSTWYSINVTTLTATAFTVTGSTGSGNDVVWIGGFLYFASGQTLYTIDLSTDAETSVAVGTLPSGGSFGAAWSDKPNDLFLSNNNTGDIYQVTNFTTGSPTATQVATGILTGNNDGAACKLADSPFNLPVANDDFYSVTSDTTLNVDAADGVLANDSGAGLSVLSSTAPSHGTLSLDPDGAFTYIPTTGYSGTDSFTYRVQDEYARDSAGAATVTIDVNLPAAPQANDDSYSTTAGTTLTETAPAGLLANDTGTGIAISSSTTPAEGSLTLNSGGSFTYVPASGGSGIESFSYTITDAFGRTSMAEVRIDVTPTVEDGSATTPYDTPLVEPAPGVLSGAVGSGLWINSYYWHSGATVSIDMDGALTFTPSASFTGSYQFGFTAEDSSGLTVSGTFTVGVGVPAAPVAATYDLTTAADTNLDVTSTDGVLSQDSGASITVTGNSDPSDGSVSMSPDGSFTYTPDSGFSGYDSFTYTITDAVGQTATGWVDVDVTPVAVDQSFDTGFETPITVDVLTADIGSGLTGGDLLTTPTDDGTWSFSDGSLTFTPAAGFVGDATFTYGFTDGSEQSATGTVTFDVADPAAPVAGEVDFSAAAGQTLNGGTGALFTNSTGYEIAVQSTTSPSDGDLVSGSSGSFSYTPASGFSGVDSFDFTITDPFGQTSTAEAVITVDPVANDIGYSTPCGSTLTVPASDGLLSTDLGSSLTVASVTSHTTLGSLAWHPDGSFTYTPAAGQCSQANTLDYTLSDRSEDEASATVTFDVGPPASVLDLSYSVNEDGSLTLDAGSGLLQWVTGPGITLVAYTQPGYGSVTAGTDGSFTYTPDPGYSGPDSFTYTAEDGYGVIGVGTVTISVEPAVTGVGPTTSPTTPDTGVGGGRGLWVSLAGLALVLLGVASLVAVRRRRRPALPED